MIGETKVSIKNWIQLKDFFYNCFDQNDLDIKYSSSATIILIGFPIIRHPPNILAIEHNGANINNAELVL